MYICVYVYIYVYVYDFVVQDINQEMILMGFKEWA